MEFIPSPSYAERRNKMNEIIKRELTTIALKSMLNEWKKTKSIEKAYDICTLLCEHFGIVKGTDLEID